LTRTLIVASAGAGKTQRIISEAKFQAASGKNILVVTYTENNQKELLHRYSGDAKFFTVKGLFSFLLEDIVRPYQRCFFSTRISTINFNSGGDPHKVNGRTIPGRKEALPDGMLNPVYYLTKCEKKAHTTYLAKLATKIMKKREKEVLARLEDIYSHIYIDEVQDLVGWDYEVLKILSKSKLMKITCVGDFRQTIYDTSSASKGPKSTKQKLEKFVSMNFDVKNLAVSRRSVKGICDFSDTIHSNEGYKKTLSLTVNLPYHNYHTGVFCVRESYVNEYIREFSPVILRHGVNSGKRYNEMDVKKINFGKSKGLSFDRTLIIPTQAYLRFISGEKNIFSADKTEASKNKLYVASTRAKYSTAFVVPDSQVDKCLLSEWKKDWSLP